MTVDFGQYEILSEIGRGGMGIVYQALDHEHQRMVAIKHLILENVDPTKHREFKDRFRREAAMAARLDHPNIVSVYDVEAGAENNYYVMEFLVGRSLRKELEQRGGSMTAGEYFEILKQVGEGLAYAHSLNVVHRDVKPDNIFILEDGRVKITDFGIARTVDYEQTHLTKTGVMLGTLAYVSPEQLQDAKNVDHRADLFSLGVVSYEALSGRLPFTGEGIAATVIKILSTEAESLHLLTPKISVETAAVISKALRKKARDRFMSVIDFVKEYERSLSAGGPFGFLDPNATQAGVPSPVKAAMDSMKIYTPGIPIDLSGIARAAQQQSLSPDTPVRPPVNLSNNTVSASAPASFYMVKPLTVLGKAGEGDGCFTEPAVVYCRSGRIVVADSVQRSVQVFAKDGRFITKLSANPAAKNTKTGGGSFTTPSGATIDYRGRIYISDSGDHFIRVFDGQGRFLKEFLNTHGKDGGIQGIVCDSTGLLYISDGDNGCLQVFQSDLGTWLRQLSTKGSDPGQLRSPSGLAVDRLNQVYVVDYITSKVSVFTKLGAFLRSFGGKGNANGLFNVPRGIAVDKRDRIFVADSLNHRVQVFGPAGDWLHSFGGKGNDIGKFVAPSGLSIDPETNCLYVADRGNRRVQVFELLDS